MIKTWAVTDTGLVRKENQDTYRIARNGDICVVCVDRAVPDTFVTVFTTDFFKLKD